MNEDPNSRSEEILVALAQAGLLAVRELLKCCERCFAPLANLARGDPKENLRNALASIEDHLVDFDFLSGSFGPQAEQLARDAMGISKDSYRDVTFWAESRHAESEQPLVEELFQRVRDGVSARDKLIRLCEKWLKSMAYSFKGTWKAPEDFLQVACNAIYTGLPTYKPEQAKGGFRSWACVVARNAMTRELHIRPEIYRQIKTLREAHDRISIETGRKPTTAEIAERAGFPEGRVSTLLNQYALAFETSSVGATLAISQAPNPLTHLEQKELTAKVRKAMASIPERYRWVLELVYLHDIPQSSTNPEVKTVASILGISGAAARQLLQRARKLLREAFRRLGSD